VLKVHVIRGDGFRYYVDDLVPGRAEGGLVAGESPGIWTGRGAVALGLAGRVEPPAFGEVLAGRDPHGVRALRQSRRHRSVAGFDLTFCAPKSVSLLHLLAPGEMATEVGDGHRTAVEETVGYLGRWAVGVRRSRGGEVTLLPATGVVAGEFVHRTSRALDPHLHTHLVVANVAEGADGAWSAVDSRRLFAHVPAAQAVYHARLRFELTRRLGVAWEVPPSGLGDVVGVDRRLRRLFSSRTAAIDEYDHGRPRPAGSPVRSGRTRGGFHTTRPAKDRSRTVESLATEWRERAAEFGHDLGDLTSTVGRGRRPDLVDAGHPFDPGRLRTRLESLAEQDRVVSRRDLVGLVAISAHRGAAASEIESAAARIADACARSDHGSAVAGRSAPAHRSFGRGGAEPRWSAGHAAHVVDRDGDRLLVTGPPPPAPGMAVDGGGSRGRGDSRDLVAPDRVRGDRAVEIPGWVQAPIMER
jgi:conjugative relaxase-like TrwC/TraI family protein